MQTSKGFTIPPPRRGYFHKPPRRRFAAAALALALMTTVLCGCAGARINGGRITLDGQPFFPVEVYSLKNPQAVAGASDLGFNATINEFPQTIRAAQAAGLSVTVPDWFEGSLDLPRLDTRITRYRRLKGVWAWNVGDEPDLRPRKSPPELVGRAARYIRALMPHTLISVTLSGAQKATDLWPVYVHDVDIIRVAAYPLLEGADARLLYDRIRLAREIPGDRPVIAVLDQWTMPGKTYPTLDQLRRSLYAALTADAAGISVYQYEAGRWQGTPEFARQMKGFIAETHRVGRLLAKAPQRASSSKGDLRRLDFTTGNRRFVLAVNLGLTSVCIPLKPKFGQRCRQYPLKGGPAIDLKTDKGPARATLEPGTAVLLEQAPFWIPALSWPQKQP